MDKISLNMDGFKSPMRSPARSPALSPARSPVRSPNRSPNKSPNKSPSISPGRSPSRASPSYGSPPHARHRSASIPVTPEALKGVRSRFLNAPGALYPLGEGIRDNTNLLSVETDSRGRLPRSAPELTVDEASPSSLSPWNDDPSEYSHSLASTVYRPQAEVLSRRFSETLTVSNDYGHHHRRHRRKSLSPHHSRSLSFRALKKTGEEFRPRGNSVPCADPLHPKSRRMSYQYRDRSASPRPSLPLEADDDNYYMLRQFCITSKGDVINKGDLYRQRSRSNNSMASTGSSVTAGTAASTATSLSSERPGTAPKTVFMMGSVGVGKTTLVGQFVSSEYMNNAYDGSIEEDAEKNVSILLDGEEYEVNFLDPPTMAETPTEEQTEADGYVVVYSITDRCSFEKAIDILFKLRESGRTINKAVILVGNKSDLVRSRVISTDEAKSVACTYECKFTETSAIINHQVDELLVGIVTQIRLKGEQQMEMNAFSANPSKEGHSLRKRMSLGNSSRRAKGILNKLMGKGKLKSQSCGNLHVL